MIEHLMVGSVVEVTQVGQIPENGGNPFHLFHKYLLDGGLLSHSCWVIAAQFLEGSGLVPENKASRAQVKGMQDHSQVPITPEQADLYVVLREASGLDDQPLLAEVIRLTDMANLTFFMSIYPNIFDQTKPQKTDASLEAARTNNIYGSQEDRLAGRYGF